MSFDFLKELTPRQRRALAVHRAYKSCLGGPDGKLVLADMAKRCFIGRSTFRGDPNEMLVNEGKRLAMLQTLQLLGVTEEQLLERLQETEARDE